MTSIAGERIGESPSQHRERRSFLGDNFTIEEVILYGFGAVMLVMFSLMFNQVQLREEQLAGKTTAHLAEWLPRSGDSLALSHVKAQLALSALRYEQAQKTSAGIAARRNSGFLVGTLLALLGCVVAIRGTRGSDIQMEIAASEAVKAKIATASSGAFIVLVGALIVLATVLNNDHVEVRDQGITLFAGAAGAAAANTATESPQLNDARKKLIEALQKTK